MTSMEGATSEHPIQLRRVVGGIDLASLPEELPSEQIQHLLDAADEVDFQCVVITINNMKRVVSQLTLRIQRNQEQRLKYPNDPEKFLKSELDLDEEVTRMKGVAVTGDLLAAFLNEGGFALLIPLLIHSNSDVAGTVASTLTELTSPDIVMEMGQDQAFIEAILNAGFPSFLGDLLMRLDENSSQDDYEIVTSCLQVADNLLELNPDVFSEAFVFRAPNFLSWLFRRIRGYTDPTQKNALPPVCYNRCYAAELLAIILQTCVSCRKEVGQRSGIDGVEKLLRCLAVYRKRNPESADEDEFVANIGNCLASLLEEPANQFIFSSVLGIDLMIRLMRDRMQVYSVALKLLVYALHEHPSNCQLFVERLGLKSLFGIFMKRGTRSRSGSRADREEDEHCLNIILHLCRHTVGTPCARLLNKFVEAKCEKLERLLELHQHYYPQVLAHIQRKKVLNSEIEALDKELNIDTEDAEYLDQCEAGLFILQTTDIILICLANMGNALVSQRIHWYLNIKGIFIDEINQVVTGYLRRLSAESDEKKKLTVFLDAFLKGDDMLPAQ